MQAVILAAGQSSRLYPFANGKHKSMIFFMGKPLLAHTIEGLKQLGITDIILVVNSESVIPSYFADGKRHGVSLSYVIQEQPNGMGDALLKAKKHITSDFLLLHGYHVDVVSLGKLLLKKKETTIDGLVIAKKRDDTWKYGVLQLNGTKIEKIIEKPKKGEELSKNCIIGVYYLSKIFFSLLEKVPLEHYQFESALSLFAKEKHLEAVITDEETVVLKYPWDLFGIKDYLLKRIKRSISKNVKIADTAQIIGEVVIEDGVTIMEGTTIKGPCYIGKNVFIGNHAILRGGTIIEDNAVIGARMEVKNSIVMQATTTHSGFIGDSIIGENCKIAAQFCTANARLKREIVKVLIKNEPVETGYTHLGTMIGEKTSIGIKAGTMPGVVIGKNVTIGPGTMVMQNVPDDTKYYTKFQEIVEKKLTQ